MKTAVATDGAKTTISFEKGAAAPTVKLADGKTLADAKLASIDLSKAKDLEDGAEVKVAVAKDGSNYDVTVKVGNKEYKATGVTSANAAANKDITLKLNGTDATDTIDIKTGTSGMAAKLDEVTLGTIDAPGAGDTPGTISFWIGAEAGDANQLTIDTMSLEVGDISIADPEDTGVGVKLDGKVTPGDISKVDITTAEKAMSFLETIKSASDSVSNMRGTLGAMQNRLDHTLKNLSVMQENMQDAESVIRDTDVADEMMAYTKNNILVQSAQAMLAQANQIPQGVLQLLQ